MVLDDLGIINEFGLVRMEPRGERGEVQPTIAPTIDTSSRTGKLVMGILALIAGFENDIRRERQMDGIRKAHERGVRFGRKPRLVPEKVEDPGAKSSRSNCARDHSTNRIQ